MITTTLAYSTDLDRGVVMTPLHNAFLTGDQEAHRFDVQCYRGRSREEADMSGARVNGYFIRADGTTVIIPGTAEGNTVSVTLPAACYARLGRFSLVMKATRLDVTTTVLWVEGAVSRSRTDAVSDPDEVVPNLDALLALVARLENQVTNIYIGSDTPPENYNVWIDPAGQAAEGDLPPGSAPYQMIVTGPDGVSRWEERTHYDYSGGTVLPLTDLAVVGGYATFTEPFSTLPQAGTPYKVTYLGYEYDCTGIATEADGKPCVIIGNESHMGSGLNTQEPFIFVFYNPEDVTDGIYGWFSCLATDKSTIPVSIVGNGELKKIDKKFLPDNIGGMPEGGAPYQQLVTDGEGNTVWADRLAYEDPNALAVVLPETELVDTGDDGFIYTQPLGITLVSGETYTVTYNGATFDCTAVDATALNPDLAGAVILGNVEVMNGSGDTGEPFFAMVLPDALVSGMGVSVMCMPIDGATSVTLAIAKNGVLKRIPQKFMPSHIYGVEITKEGTLLDMTFAAEGTSKIMYFEGNPIPLEIVPGEVYTVTWNGVNYPCVANKENGGVDQNGETVWNIIIEYPDIFRCGIIEYPSLETPVLMAIQSYDGTSETQIVISGKAGKIRKVPEQFLPDVTLMSPNGTKYKLTVADDGTLSATAV